MAAGFHHRLALALDSMVIRRVVAAAPKWTAERRLQVALANDNHAPWWLVLSKKTVADIERRFVEGSVAGLMYKKVGGILGDHNQLKHGGKHHYLYMQLRDVDDDLRLCLKEAGVVKVVSQTTFDDIRYY